MDLKNILVPIDFSACSKNALREAIHLAKKVNAKIHMVNAVHIHTPQPNYSSAAILDTLFADYDAQVKQSFDELESELIELKDVPHEADRFLSYLTDAIHAELETKEIDLIVMGTRKRHESIDYFLGTNATDVIQSTSVPVIVIPETAQIGTIAKIAFAADLKKISNIGKLDVLASVAKIYESEVLAFHVEEGPFDISKEDEKLMHEISKQLEGISSSVRTCEAKDIAEGIREFVMRHEVDMLAMIPRRHNLFDRLFNKSMTKTIALDPEIPLLAFHDL
jgi:nucleotide-binding universal stress UspA family protein